MNVEFADAELQKVEEDFRYNGGYPPDIVKAFRRRMRMIRAALDERDIRRIKGNHFEKLQDRVDEHSVRLNRQWRLILKFETGEEGRIAVIIRIEDYH